MIQLVLFILVSFCTQAIVDQKLTENGVFMQYVTMNIEDVKVGDLVYSYNTLTGEVELAQVTTTFALRSNHLNYLTIIDAAGKEQVIESTDGHPFWVVTDNPDLSRAARSVIEENGVSLYHESIEPGLNGYWVEAKDLRVGDIFLGANGGLSTLTNIVRVEQEGGVAVFNFTVKGNHNYFILAKEYNFGQTCVLVHNACPPVAGDIMSYKDWVDYYRKNGAGKLQGHHPVSKKTLGDYGYDPNNAPVILMDKKLHEQTTSYGRKIPDLADAIEIGFDDPILRQVAGPNYTKLLESTTLYHKNG